MPCVRFKPWVVPNFVRSDDRASIPYSLGQLTKDELDAQIARFEQDVRAKAAAQRKAEEGP